MDIDKSEFIDDFIEDMNELMGNAEISLKKLEEGSNQDLINELFRVAHSIKGMSASMEFVRMEMLTHKLEDLMYIVRDNTIPFSKEILDILQTGFAFLNELFVSIKIASVEDEAPCEGLEILIESIKKILDANGKGSRGKPIEKAKPVEEKKVEVTLSTNNNVKILKSINKLAKITVIIEEKCVFKSVRAFMVLNKISEFGEFIRTIPSEIQIKSKEYEMHTNILSIFLELEKNLFTPLKDDILDLMEIKKVEVEYVKDIPDDKVIEFCDELEINKKDIVNEIEKIELKIVKMEHSEEIPIFFSELKTDILKLSDLLNEVCIKTLSELMEKILELIDIMGNKDLSDRFLLIETLLDSFINLKDAMSAEDENQLETDIYKIEDNIVRLNSFINEEKNKGNVLGEILVEQGVLKKEDIKEILSTQEEKPNKKFGEIAVEEKKATSKDIVNALKIQNSKNDKKDEGLESLKVPVTKADHLIDLLEELMMVQSQLEKNILNDFSKDSIIVKTMMTSFRITKEIQNLSISFRMITLRNIFQKVNMTVRDSLKKLDKKAQIRIYGEDTEIDRVVGNKIIDPLLHLVKNSAAHGIEMPSERLKCGKSESGLITISAKAEKGHVYIEISDDGQGMDPNKIYASALKKGVITGNESFTEEDIINLVFAPGLSTAQEVDTISGRGVGMDVVKTELSKLGGKISIINKLGQGVTFLLRIPQNMTSLNGTVVDVKGKKYVIPTVYIKEVFCINEETFVNVVGKTQFVKLRQKIIPIIPTKEYFDGEDNSIIMIVLDVDGTQKALPVNQVMERREIVVKPLSDDFDYIRYLSGASILGDGTAALILNIEQLFKLK